MAEIKDKSEIEKAIRDLQRALEVGMYYGEPSYVSNLKHLLGKLGLKSGRTYVDLHGGSLTMESLEDMLSKVAYRGGKP